MIAQVLAQLWMPKADELRQLAPLWSLVGTIVAVLLAALIVGRNWRIISGVAVLGATLTAALCWNGFQNATGSFAGVAPSSAHPMLIVDQFSYFFIFLASVFLIFVTGMWYLGQQNGGADYLARRGDVVEFFVLLLGSAFGMALMVSTSNLLMIVLAVEMASLPSYGLAGYRKKHRLSAEASLKYVLFGAITSAIMIYGASLLYGQYHTLDLGSMGEVISRRGGNLVMGVGLFAFMVGVAFKVSAVPFHFWCPDVFEGAAIEVTTWLSVASKAAGVGLMLRIISVLAASMRSPAMLDTVATAVAIMAALTCTVGNFSAFRQTNLKRFLAFSSIAHAGYMLMAVAIIWRPQFNQAGVVHPAFSAIIIYSSIYVLMNLGAFGVVAMIYWSSGREDIGGFAGLGSRNPMLALIMVVCLFSLVGLPPFGGFMAKWYLLLALYDAKLIWLIFVAVFNTLISLYYYARVAYAMYFTQSDEAPVRTPIAGQAVVAACAVGIILTGTLWAGRIKSFGDARSTDLYKVAGTSQASNAGVAILGAGIQSQNPGPKVVSTSITHE